MKIQKRTDWAGFINVAAKDGATADFALMGTGFSEQGDSPSAQTSDKQYVNMKGKTKNIIGYDWSSPFTADQIPEEKAIAFLINIGSKELTGEDADTEYVQVDFTKKVGSTGQVYEAKKRDVACEIADFSNNDGEMQVEGNLLAKNDWIEGKFDMATKTFTALEAATE